MRKFSIQKLSKALKKLEYIEFAILFGSAKTGVIGDSSDIDLAVYFSEDIKVKFEHIADILKITANIIPDVNCDICRLNTASETLRYESLKGKILFVRNMNLFSSFYSLTCREYEDYIYWTARQLHYRGIS